MITWFSRKKKSSSSSKDDFVSLSSHALRSPLSVIKWYTEILLDGDVGELTEDQRKYLRVIEISNQRAIDLIRSLLNVSRLDLGTFSISPEEIAISEVVKSATDLFKDISSKKTIKIIIEESENLKKIQADKHLVTLVLKQLMSNAIAFSEEGSIVTIRTSVTRSGTTIGEKLVDKESIIVSISDTGLGIPEAEKEKIFSKMFRGSNVKDGEDSDGGLGLYVAKTIINYVGGDIWFVSTLGKGTTFYVTFPTKGMGKKIGTTVLE
jgi:signal transduction histidine kinase